MSKLVLDDATLEQLRKLRETTELCTPAGVAVGLFTPAVELSGYGYVEPTLSDEELARRRRRRKRSKRWTNLLKCGAPSIRRL